MFLNNNNGNGTGGHKNDHHQHQHQPQRKQLKFSCQVCGKAYATEVSYRKHVEGHHNAAAAAHNHHHHHSNNNNNNGSSSGAGHHDHDHHRQHQQDQHSPHGSGANSTTLHIWPCNFCHSIFASEFGELSFNFKYFLCFPNTSTLLQPFSRTSKSSETTRSTSFRCSTLRPPLPATTVLVAVVMIWKPQPPQLLPLLLKTASTMAAAMAKWAESPPTSPPTCCTSRCSSSS